MKKIAFCGGGSAGHVMPNIALYEILNKEYDIIYVGTNGIEKDICQKFGIKFYQFEGVKFVRGKLFCNLTIPFKLIKSINRCSEILQNTSPDILFCKGGYASLPPAFAAHKLGIPVLSHESDLTAGLANKLIAGKSQKMLTSFPCTAAKLKNGLFVGSPMRNCLFNRDRAQAKAHFGLDERPTVLVFGGGSGSKIINESLRKCIFNLCKNYNVLHLCGKGNAVQSTVSGYRQIEFCDDMGLAYACADIAVARCGSNSAHELIALKIPTLFIPLDNGATRGDQIKNAEYFKARGLCRVLAENELIPQKLLEEIQGLSCDEQIKTALQKTDLGCGNDKIIKEIKRILEER